jgi:hypothetical protein
MLGAGDISQQGSMPQDCHFSREKAANKQTYQVMSVRKKRKQACKNRVAARQNGSCLNPSYSEAEIMRILIPGQSRAKST